MDGQENELRGRLRGSGSIVARRGDGIVLVIFDNALFDGGTDLSGGGTQILRALAVTLRHYDHTALQIVDYTDTTGSPDKNAEVSDRRAKAVAASLPRLRRRARRPHVRARLWRGEPAREDRREMWNEPRNRRIEIRITATPVG